MNNNLIFLKGEGGASFLFAEENFNAAIGKLESFQAELDTIPAIFERYGQGTDAESLKGYMIEGSGFFASRKRKDIMTWAKAAPLPPTVIERFIKEAIESIPAGLISELTDTASKMDALQGSLPFRVPISQMSFTDGAIKLNLEEIEAGFKNTLTFPVDSSLIKDAQEIAKLYAKVEKLEEKYRLLDGSFMHPVLMQMQPIPGVFSKLKGKALEDDTIIPIVFNSQKPKSC